MVKSDLTLLSVEAKRRRSRTTTSIAILEEERRLAAQAGRRAAVPIPAQQMLSRTLRPARLPSATRWAMRRHHQFALQRDRGSRRPRERDELRQEPSSASREPLVEERDSSSRRARPWKWSCAPTARARTRSWRSRPRSRARVKVAALAEGQRVRVLVAPGPRPGDARQVVRVVLFGERGVEGIAAANDRGAVRIRDAATDDSGQQVAAGRRRGGRDDRGGARLYDSLYETALKNDAAAPDASTNSCASSATTSISSGASPAATTSRSSTASTTTTAPPRSSTPPSRSAARARRVYRYQGDDGSDRLLRRTRPLAEEVPAAQADRRRHHALGLRHRAATRSWAIPRCIRASTGRTGSARRSSPPATAPSSRRNGNRLRPAHRDPARQRLRDRLFAPVAIRQRHLARRQGPAGPGRRLCRQYGPLDRPAPPLRGHRQRPLRRSR